MVLALYERKGNGRLRDAWDSGRSWGFEVGIHSILLMTTEGGFLWLRPGNLRKHRVCRDGVADTN
jgi:hypothetical protein